MTKAEFQKGFAYFLAHARNFFFGMDEDEQKLAIGTYFIDLYDMPVKKFEYSLKKICNNVTEFKHDFNFVGKVRQHGKGFIPIETKVPMLTDGEREDNKKKVKVLVDKIWKESQ